MSPGHGAVPGDGGPFTGRRSRRVFMGIGATSPAGLLAAGIPTPAEASPTTGRGHLNVFNVRSFGARGDGATDDTRAIQRAIDAAVSGGIIFFPPGPTRSPPPSTAITGPRSRSWAREGDPPTLPGAARSDSPATDRRRSGRAARLPA
jgi:Pectate lyase superfamily protein